MKYEREKEEEGERALEKPHFLFYFPAILFS